MAHLVERRHIGATDRRELLDNLSARDALVAQAAMQLANLEQRLLASPMRMASKKAAYGSGL